MTQEPKSRPNIIVILADDMGFSDLGCYGSEIATPNLDSLAAGGLRFSQMYNSARCCPSRAALLTGLNPQQTGVGHMVADLGMPAYQGYLNESCVTIAEVLGSQGYTTLMTGKWHVGGGYDLMDPASWTPGATTHPTPTQRGFDRFFGIVAGAANYFSPLTLMRDDTLIDLDTLGDDFYLTDAISDNAAQMIDDAAEDDRPFFLHVTYTAPHWPLHAPEEEIAKYKGKYRQGWDTLRTNRHEELKGMKILDSKWEISPRHEDSPDWGDVPNRDWEDLRMAVYAAMIDRVDQGIGRILARLREREMLEHTLNHVPGGQRWLRGVPRGGWAGGPAVAVRDAVARWAADESRQRPGAASGPGRHLHELRHALGQREQHALPPVQAVGARGRHLDAADRVVVGTDQ